METACRLVGKIKWSLVTTLNQTHTHTHTGKGREENTKEKGN